MDKELCLKFLVHLHKCATTALQKSHIDEIDITYINNEVDNFHRKLDKEKAGKYDPAGALGAIEKIKEESVGEKVIYVSKFLLKAKYKMLSLVLGTKDDAHVKREAKIGEFRERVKKVLALVEFSAEADHRS